MEVYSSLVLPFFTWHHDFTQANLVLPSTLKHDVGKHAVTVGVKTFISSEDVDVRAAVGAFSTDKKQIDPPLQSTRYKLG